MTSEELARAYLRKGRARLGALAHLRDAGDHSDVVREAQELVELALKAMLRAVGIEPPRLHDVGGLLLEYEARFPVDLRASLGRAADVSARLRHERERAFYGEVDFIPTEEYTADQATQAYDAAAWVLALAQEAVGRLRGPADSAPGPPGPLEAGPSAAGDGTDGLSVATRAVGTLRAVALGCRPGRSSGAAWCPAYGQSAAGTRVRSATAHRDEPPGPRAWGWWGSWAR